MTEGTGEEISPFLKGGLYFITNKNIVLRRIYLECKGMEKSVTNRAIGGDKKEDSCLFTPLFLRRQRKAAITRHA
ncbi:MAG: hypothetical protein E5X94_00405 [Mesorhizobium sp.]|nr:MAG: hypothetical protein E5X94_00405 [Mesorhizobium sp.]